MNATELVLGISTTPIPVTSFINSRLSSDINLSDFMSSTVAMDFVTTTLTPETVTESGVRSWLTNLIMQVCIQKNC